MPIDPPPPGTPPGRRFFVEIDAPERCPLDFLDDPTVVLFFASWAFSVQFGGMHELAQAALHLRRRYKIDLKPLTRYADRHIEDSSDRREFDRAWQEPEPLAACSRAVASAVEAALDGGDGHDTQLREWMTGYEELPPRLRELAAMCDWAASRQARVRLTFLLES